jgi:hypothetical protein
MVILFFYDMIGFYSSLWIFTAPFILYDLGSHCGSAQAFLVALRFPGYFGCSFICRIFLSFSNHTFLPFLTISGVFLSGLACPLL